MRWMVLALWGLAGCETDPDRPDPSQFTSARDQEFVPPTPNTCETLLRPFAITATGYVEAEFAGLAGYEYKSTDDLTSIYLENCQQGQNARVFAMHRYGRDRVEPGTYTFDMDLLDESNFNFSFVDNKPADRVSCADQPEGQLVIEEADFAHVKGSFEVTVRCTSEELLGRIPQATTFVGTFDAENVGIE
jgi:hypothetical protein